MKTQISLYFLALTSVISFAACNTQESNGGSSENTSFAKAEIYYYYDEFVQQVGSYGIALYNNANTGSMTELYLDFSSDYFADALKAAPANGTYTFSDSFAQNTFNSTYSSFIKKNGSSQVKLDLVDGQFSISRSASNYTLNYDVKLEDGSTVKGRYQGEIVGLYDATIASDMTLDFNAMNDLWAEVVSDGEGQWNVILTGKQGAGSQVGIVLMVNGMEEASSLPAGNFPMARQARQGQEQTTEPASAYNETIDGCHFINSGGGISWAVPGEGFVEIVKEGGAYKIDFSFEDANGHTVSGQFAGKINTFWKTRAAQANASILQNINVDNNRR